MSCRDVGLELELHMAPHRLTDGAVGKRLVDQRAHLTLRGARGDPGAMLRSGEVMLGAVTPREPRRAGRLDGAPRDLALSRQSGERRGEEMRGFRARAR